MGIGAWLANCAARLAIVYVRSAAFAVDVGVAGRREVHSG